MRIHSRRRKRTRGSALMEAAFIFLTFFAVIAGIFDFSQALLAQQALTERARSAARWGAIYGPTDATSIRNMVLYNQSGTPSGGTAGYFNLQPSNVNVSTSGSGTDDYRLNVSITGYNYSLFSVFVAGQYTAPPIVVSVPLGLYN